MTKVNISIGACRMYAQVTVKKRKKYMVDLEIESDCDHIQRMAEEIGPNPINGLEEFRTIFRSKVYQAADKTVPHPICTVPAGVLKAIEAELELALPRDSTIKFIK
jgi:hypothetical protein